MVGLLMQDSPLSLLSGSFRMLQAKQLQAPLADMVELVDTYAGGACGLVPCEVKSRHPHSAGCLQASLVALLPDGLAAGEVP